MAFLLKRLASRENLVSASKEQVAKHYQVDYRCPLYMIALPSLLIFRQHYFMKYFVRLFDHLGRLLAMLRLNPIEERCH